MARYTIEQLEALESAYAEGATKVKYQDKEIEYRSRKEMRGIIEEMRQELGIKKSNTSNRKIGLYSSGL